MNTLIVHYLPRGDYSHTKTLLDTFIESVEGSDLQFLDLIDEVPDLFLPERLMAYIHRDYLGETLPPAQAQLLERMDRLADQLVQADAVVLATPMHNFSVPAIVKAWFDSVMLKDQTWYADESGYHGKLTGKRALLLMASGGIWDGDLSYMEHAESLVKVEFEFMGCSRVDVVRAGGINLPGTNVEELLASKRAEVAALAADWCK